MARSALARTATHRPDAAIVGALETPVAAVEFIRSVRSSGGLGMEPSPDLPILAFVDPGDEMAVVRCFETGADDVATRRGAYPVLRARLRVLLGLAGRHAVIPSAWRVGPLEVNVTSREVHLHSEVVALSGKEFALLSALIAEPERVFTREELLRDVWGFRSPGQTRTLDSHAARLRRKLGAHGDAFIVNVRGVGYRLTDRPARELGAVA